ncbi:MAG TPA: RsmG family class I SAM-dependent methyltransferase [Candidatus Sulfotelmatobacter sp.]|nr:RsmG family class I SAM-dependent methyltransferase [Candidatus Sulfotelmatobacter sp.]
MQPARIAELLQPFLDPADERWPTTDDLDRISTYIDLLLRWNARINLTAIRSEDEIVTRHFGESFFLARHLLPPTYREGRDFSPAKTAPESDRASMPEEERTYQGTASSRAVPAVQMDGALAREVHAPPEDKAEPDSDTHRGRAALQGRVRSQEKIGALAPEEHTRKSESPLPPTLADVGSGAGFPGIPIKLWAPHIHVTLIESNLKKSTFLREVVRAITLTDIDIQNIRAEDLDRHFDIVTIRAVERFEEALPIASRLVAPLGRLALLIGSVQFDQAMRSLPMFLWEHPIPIPLSRSRILAVALMQG